jgi:secondary thiamine-phosphate synthase enzyme
MPVTHHTFHLETKKKWGIVDITNEVVALLRKADVNSGLCTVYTPHATAAIAINENDDPNIGVDLIHALDKMVKEHDGWLHDRIDNNAAAHIKSAIIGPSETIPIIDGKLALGTWQNIFLCELDGPRSSRRVIVSIYS